jgi:hypothetical protein
MAIKEITMKKLPIFFVITLMFTLLSYGGIQWHTTITIVGTGKGVNNEIKAVTYAQGGNVKQVFEGVSNENPFYFQKGYWLYKADENNIYIVNDANYTYMVMSMDDLLQMTGMLGQLVKITIKDASVNTEVLPVEKLLGYSCRHLKITSEYTMKMKITVIKKTLRIHEVKEIWGSARVRGLKEIGKSYLNKDFKTGIEDLDKLMEKQLEQQKNIGFPLKIVTTSLQKGKKGKVKSKTTTTIKVTKITSKTMPKSFFEIPANYDKVKSPGGKKLGIL